MFCVLLGMPLPRVRSLPMRLYVLCCFLIGMPLPRVCQLPMTCVVLCTVAVVFRVVYMYTLYIVLLSMPRPRVSSLLMSDQQVLGLVLLLSSLRPRVSCCSHFIYIFPQLGFSCSICLFTLTFVLACLARSVSRC